MHLASLHRCITLPLLLSACALPKVLGENPGEDSTGAGETTGLDPSGPDPTSAATDEPATTVATSQASATSGDTVATSEASATSLDTATTAIGTTDETGAGPLCPGNPQHTCTVPIDCVERNCGALGSPFDADGCLRPSCDDAPCGADEVCWADEDAGCASTVTACADNEGMCACVVNDDCGGHYCYPAGEAPPAQCGEITDEAACLAAGCSSFETASTLTRDGDQCICGEPLPACLWFLGDITGDDAPAPFYNLNSLQVVVFSTAWNNPPHTWAPCVGEPGEPPACTCASIGDDPCT